MKRLFWSLLALPLALAVGCDGGDDDDGTTIEPKLSALHAAVLSTETCVSAGCHDTGAAGGLDFTKTASEVHADLLADSRNATGAMTWPKRVVAGDPNMSYFYINLTRDDAPGGRMPLARPALPADQIAAFRMWIENGAAND